jgi:hypothetical protein
MILWTEPKELARASDRASLVCAAIMFLLAATLVVIEAMR